MTRDTETLRLLKAIRRLSRALDQQSRRIDRAVGLTLPQFVVLTCVADLGEVTGRAISAAADLSPPTVVGVLDKLEAKGLIERYRSARDRRVVHTRLTERGARALAAAPAPLGPEFTARLESLSPDLRATLVGALDTLGRLVGPAEASADADAE